MSYISLEKNFVNKTVLITGGTSGIGKACVEMFANLGANVVTLGRRRELGDQLSSLVNAKGKGSCTYFVCDVKDTQRIKDIVNQAYDRFGRLDTLVNCAGYFPGQRSIDNWSLEEVNEIIQTNLVAYIAASKFALPFLRLTKGSIINIGSVHGTTSVEGSVGYDATKGAIDAITRTLAIDEARHGVRVNNVKPGLIATEMYELTVSLQGDQQGFMAWNENIQWLGRPGIADEVAYAVVFLASDQASFITGAELMVSGGYEIGEGQKKYNPFLD